MGSSIQFGTSQFWPRCVKERNNGAPQHQPLSAERQVGACEHAPNASLVCTRKHQSRLYSFAKTMACIVETQRMTGAGMR